MSKTFPEPPILRKGSMSRSPKVENVKKNSINQEESSIPIQVKFPERPESRSETADIIRQNSSDKSSYYTPKDMKSSYAETLTPQQSTVSAQTICNSKTNS